MKTRLDYYHDLAQHPWFCKIFKRLKESDHSLAFEFLTAHADLDKGNFELKVNRMFIDKQRPKNYKEIMELLICANSSL